MKYKFENKPEQEEVVWKSALLLENMAFKAHAFAEGNKRTSFASVILFLEENGYGLRTSTDKEVQ